MELALLPSPTNSIEPEVDSGNVFIDQLPLDDRSALLEAATIETLADKQILTHQGERVEGIWFPSSACLAEYRLGDDGKRIRLAIVASNGATTISPVSGDAPSPHQTICVKAGGALKLSAVDYTRLISTRPSLLLAFLRLIDLQLEEARDLAMSNAFHSVDHRVARWILRTSQLFGSTNLSTTQEDVALDLGVQRSTVVASFRSLKADRIIRHTRGNLRIANRERLEAIAGASPNLSGASEQF